VFQQIRALLRERSDHPDLLITGADYPAPPSLQFLAQMAMMFQVSLLLVTIVGEQLYRFVLMVMIGSSDPTNLPQNLQIPAVIQMFSQNKVQSFLSVWLLGNMLIGGMTNTGAFEIYYGDQTLWSSLDHGGSLPKLPDILSGARRVGLTLMTSHNDR